MNGCYANDGFFDKAFVNAKCFKCILLLKPIDISFHYQAILCQYPSAELTSIELIFTTKRTLLLPAKRQLTI